MQKEGMRIHNFQYDTLLLVSSQIFACPIPTTPTLPFNLEDMISGLE